MEDLLTHCSCFPLPLSNPSTPNWVNINMATPHVTATKSNLERWPAASSSSCKCVLRHQAQGEQKKGDDDDDDDDDLRKGYRVREQPSVQGTWQSSWKLPQTET